MKAKQDHASQDLSNLVLYQKYRLLLLFKLKQQYLKCVFTLLTCVFKSSVLNTNHILAFNLFPKDYIHWKSTAKSMD